MKTEVTLFKALADETRATLGDFFARELAL